MILVTGANGHLGRRIVHHLATRLPGAGRLAVSVRDTAKAEDLAVRGIEVRRGDFDQPEDLVRAFAGIRRMVLVSTDGPKEVRVRQHRAAIEAARAAGVQHILYTSFIDAAADSPAEFAQVHHATEAALAASGLQVTLLRNPLYADFLPMTAGGALESGVFHLPAGDGKASFVSRDDLAQAIAAAAAAPRLAKPVYELTGDAAYTYHEVAQRIARVVGRPVRYEAVSEDAYAAALEGSELPAWLARAMANMYTAVAAGNFARVTNDYALLVGHPPRSLDCILAELFGKS